MMLKRDSLILYKNQPGRVTELGKKLTIEAGGQTVSVRPKDVVLLHPGPVRSLGELSSVPAGEIMAAWELLAGETTTLPDLAELAFEQFTPAAAWAIWQQVEDGVLFSGTPEAIVCHLPEQAAEIRAARAAKAAEEAEWEGVLKRVQRRQLAAEDGRFLQDVVAVAKGLHDKSRLLKALNFSETPEKAHRLLLDLGYWDEFVNPYPARFGVPTQSSAVPLPPLLDEPRRDLTHLVSLAIDDAGNKDPDDAVSWEAGVGENGRLWVHIADVAALVPPDSLADLEARARGANLYLPEGTVTMLPAEATQQLGLGLSETSPALSFGLTLSHDGTIGNVEITPSWVRVTRLSYEEAETQLDQEPFRQLLYVARLYEEKRRQNGAVQIDLPEAKVAVADGVVEIRPLPPLRSRDLVREAMLMTGEAVARFALTHNIPLPYTSQDQPSKIIEGDTPSVMFARRLTMQRSQQGSTPGRHAGLGMDIYVQSTSPLRRYLDLVVHQQLRAFLRGEPLLDAQELMERVGAADAIIGSVRQAERLSIQHWTLVYLLQHPKWQGDGIVIEQRGKRHLCLLPPLAMETTVNCREERPLDTALPIELTKVNLPALEAQFRAVE
ncbi:MAG: RNB domain-containing ribonuclease [Chloroflexota bacterium]